MKLPPLRSESLCLTAGMIALASQLCHFPGVFAAISAIIFPIRRHAVAAFMFALLRLCHVVSSVGRTPRRGSSIDSIDKSRPEAAWLLRCQRARVGGTVLGKLI